MHPPGSWQFEGDPRALQDYLATAVIPGDPVDLILAPLPRGVTEVPHFLIVHRDRNIATTSDAFGALLQGALGSSSRPPRTISGLHVEMIDTVAGDPTLGRHHGLGSHGIWGRVRAFGLGTLHFDGAEDRRP